MKMEILQKSTHRGQQVWRQGAETSQQYTITMVTAIRKLRRVWLGQRGRLERQLTEESSLTWLMVQLTTLPPPPSPIPRDSLYRPGMWLAALFLKRKKKWSGRQDSTTLSKHDTFTYAATNKDVKRKYANLTTI